MIIIRNLSISLEARFDDLAKILSEKLQKKLPDDAVVKLYRKSVDARKKDDVHFNCSFTLSSKNEKSFLKNLKKFDAEEFSEQRYAYPCVKSDATPVVVGFGPAGMFAALYLAKAGLCPTVLERGSSMEKRKKDVESFFSGGKLCENSNVQFGEGGAGTFSDGKLNTGISDLRIREVLRTFAYHGANENILYDAKPHIGTDVLEKVVVSIRNEIISLGGKVLFDTKMEDIVIENGKVTAVAANGEIIKASHLILALGHSARDSFEMLTKKPFVLAPKPFAVGMRIEHSQSLVNRAQYGAFAEHPALSAADYKLSTHLSDGRGVFTFCMCPGGEVVNASSENGYVAVNGMSYFARDGKNANSAVLVGLTPDDFNKNDVLDGVKFQREIERKAFEIGKGLPVSQNVCDFLKIESRGDCVTPSVRTGSTYGNMDDVFPSFITKSIREGILQFDKKLHGFASGVLTAPETRTTSPVRIERKENFESAVRGVFPCGEGAGYAGGITSAAVDGLRCAEAVVLSISEK